MKENIKTYKTINSVREAKSKNPNFRIFIESSPANQKRSYIPYKTPNMAYTYRPTPKKYKIDSMKTNPNISPDSSSTKCKTFRGHSFNKNYMFLSSKKSILDYYLDNNTPSAFNQKSKLKQIPTTLLTMEDGINKFHRTVQPIKKKIEVSKNKFKLKSKPKSNNQKIRINFSEDKCIKDKNGLLQLPTLYNYFLDIKVPKLKKVYEEYDLDTENDKQVKKLISEKNYQKIKDFISSQNSLMAHEIENQKKILKNKIKSFNSKRPDETSQPGIEKIFKDYNTKRAKEENIVTNRLIDVDKKEYEFINITTLDEINYYQKNKFDNVLLDVKGNRKCLVGIGDENKKANKKLTEYELTNLTNLANHKVEKLFPDLCTFQLPRILRENKEYTRKLLYDVFIEFKTLLKCCLIHNRNMNIYKKGIDFDTFFNCNTKINQQGIALSHKIYKAFNGKTNINYLPWENYFDGMMKLKDPNIDNKLDLFFQILDENGDGSFDYNEVFNLSLISLQRVLPEQKEKSDNPEENKKIEQDKEITNSLAEFLSKYIFKLVGIDIDGEIPIDLLREKMDKSNKDSDYLEFFLCADNFA